MDSVCSLFLTQILEIILDFSLSHPKTNPVVSFFKTFHHCKPFFRTNVVQVLSWVSASTLPLNPAIPITTTVAFTDISKFTTLIVFQHFNYLEKKKKIMICTAPIVSILTCLMPSAPVYQPPRPFTRWCMARVVFSPWNSSLQILLRLAPSLCT